MNRSLPSGEEIERVFHRLAVGPPDAPQVVVTSRRWLELLGVPPAAIPAGAGPFMVTKGMIEAIEIEEEPLA
jgi:hypothetical protein